MGLIKQRDLFEDDAARTAATADALIRKGASLNKLLEMSDTDLSDAADRAESDAKSRDLFVGKEPSLPLPDSRDENFVQLYVATEKGHVAYRDAYGSSASAQTCTQQASRKRREPAIAARLQWLRQQKWKAEKKLLDAPPGGEINGNGVTRAEKMRICERIFNDPTAAVTDRVRAIELHGKLEALGDEGGKKSLKDLDPTDIVEYFKQAARQGLDPAKVAADLQKEDEDRRREVGKTTAILEAPAGSEKRVFEGGDTQQVVEGALKNGSQNANV